MAAVSRTIGAAVGTRNGVTAMPNTPNDLATITSLFDQIPDEQGGTADDNSPWPMDRGSLIAVVTAQIVAFQTTNQRPVIDGVVDPAGGTLRLMNQLAAATPGGISAAVAPAPNGMQEQYDARPVVVADVALVAGTRPMKPANVRASYTRKLVRVEGSSINWFGVLIPADCKGQGCTPHINFTPTPWQGGYHDPGYDNFSTWANLWDDYTEVIGGQVAAAGVDQILVLPFYRNSQPTNMGDFLMNWREVVAAVVTAALISFDPYLLRDTFTFDSIVSSSFSNGWVAHHTFNTQSSGGAAATTVLFDLDGAAGGSNWVPRNGVIYRNRPVPRNSNPEGTIFYVGGRWGAEFIPLYGGNMNTHACCRNHLLYHGLMFYC